MLWFERQVVSTLTADLDDDRRTDVESFVDGVLSSMPEYLRACIAAESVVLGAGAGALKAAGRFDQQTIRSWLDSWSASPVGPLRQYARVLGTLVLFAKQDPAAAA